MYFILKAFIYTLIYFFYNNYKPTVKILEASCNFQKKKKLLICNLAAFVRFNKLSYKLMTKKKKILYYESRSRLKHIISKN